MLQQEINPNAKLIERGDRTFRQGDKVMQIRNNYDKEVFNGDIGRIFDIDLEEQEVAVDFLGTTVRYDLLSLDELKLAYSISVHKSQGSEFRAVIIPITTEHFIMLQRNLLYTAITRGKELVVLVGTPKALSIAVRNDQIKNRFTNLKSFLLS
jgi:exodeoxyribonuclease V alpha subunit